MSCQYVKDHYQVPAEIGRRVSVDGKLGIIAEDRGNYIGVNFDSDKPGVVFNIHPTDNVEYGEMGQIRHEKLTRSQKRYREYLKNQDWYDGTFAEWLGIYK